jgi:phosphate transport system substrate-binding protein
MFSKKLAVIILTIAIIGMVALVFGCTSPSPTPTPAAGSATPAPLSGPVTVTGSTSVGPYAEVLGQMFDSKNNGQTSVQVSQVGSGPGITATIQGTTDIGMSSRNLTDSETAQGLVAHKICDDGIAVVVNNANSLTNLSTAQIKDIFAGNITNWKDVGGKDAPIVVTQRESGSGTRDGFETLVMANKKVNVTTSAITQTSTGAVLTYVKGNPNAIGYASFGDVTSDVKPLQVDGVAPSTTTIKDKTYKLQRPFLLLTKGQPTNTVAQAFLDYVLGHDGQAYLASKNLVPVSS